jgi:uncharacterized protein involved in exopolysaccharide biosynthesis
MLQAYARQSGLLFTQEKASVSEEKLKQLQSGLSAATAERISKQSRWEMAETASPETLPDVLNDSTLREYSTKLTELRRQLAELKATYTASYPKVQKLEPQLATIDAAYQRERGAILKRIRNEFEEAQRRRRSCWRRTMRSRRAWCAMREKGIAVRDLQSARWTATGRCTRRCFRR